MRREHESGRARRCAALLASAAALGTPAQTAAQGHTCAPVGLAPSTSALPAPWRAALETLAHATAEEGLPWSCPSGTVDLVPDASGGAVLTVTDAGGRSASRRVAAPSEVVPTGEALLASPLRDAPAPAASPSAPPAATPPPVATPAGRTDPRLQIQALIGPRVSGAGAQAWTSGELRLLIPFGPWSPAAWVRYDIHVAGPSGAPVGFETSAVSAGLGVARRILSRPFELYAILDTSIAIVMMEDGVSEDLPHPEGAKPAFRLGTGLYGTFPIHGIVRGVVKLDGEFAPAGVNGMYIDPGEPPLLPPVPAYTAGLLLGIQVAVK